MKGWTDGRTDGQSHDMLSNSLMTLCLFATHCHARFACVRTWLRIIHFPRKIVFVFFLNFSFLSLLLLPYPRSLPWPRSLFRATFGEQSFRNSPQFDGVAQGGLQKIEGLLATWYYWRTHARTHALLPLIIDESRSYNWRKQQPHCCCERSSAEEAFISSGSNRPRSRQNLECRASKYAERQIQLLESGKRFELHWAADCSLQGISSWRNINGDPPNQRFRKSKAMVLCN